MIDSLLSLIKSWVRTGKNYAKGWVLIFSSILALAVLFWVVSFLVEHLFIKKFEDRGLKISFTENGATQVKIGGELKSAIFLVSASQGWVNSGIKIPPKSTVVITASGQAHVALHHLIKAAEEDRIPNYRWSDPRGVDYNGENSKADSERNEGLIVEREKIGALLACLHIDGSGEPNLLKNPRPDNIKIIGNRQNITNDLDQEATLWFTINDVVLDSSDKSEKLYLPDTNSPDYQKAKNRWKYIKENHYWNIWFDDNSGFYQVKVERVEE
jgi:hypothetical protein